MRYVRRSVNAFIVLVSISCPFVAYFTAIDYKAHTEVVAVILGAFYVGCAIWLRSRIIVYSMPGMFVGLFAAYVDAGGDLSIVCFVILGCIIGMIVDAMVSAKPQRITEHREQRAT